MAKGDDIRERLIRLGAGVMDLCDILPSTTAGKHVAGQLLRSGTSAAANYAEARGAESPTDFVHKLGITLKELDETETWLEMLRFRKMAPEDAIRNLHAECTELCKIIAVSRRTARERMRK
jgi:four helix bundle protein